MKRKHNEGFTLVELLVSIVILAAIVIPTCTSLVLSYRMNAKSEEMLQAQLAVSSAVEKLMAEGITDEYLTSLTKVEVEDNTHYYTSTEFPGLRFVLTDDGAYYSVKVMDEEEQVTVDTNVRDKTSTKKLEEVGAV